MHDVRSVEPPRLFSRAGNPPRLGLAILVYLTVVLAWSLVVPPLEAPDETGHYEYARHVANTARPLVAGAPGYDQGESFQPPLYYLIAGAIGRPLSPIPQPVIRFNDASRFFRVGSEANLFLEDTHRSTRPYIHVMRLASVLCGLGTIVCIYFIVLDFWGSTRAAVVSVIALSLVPQFGYLSAVMSNCNLVAFLSAATFIGLTRVVRADGPARSAAFLAGVCAGAALFAKMNAGILVPIAIVACALSGTPRSARWKMLFLFALGWVLVAGWWIGNDLLEGVHPLRARLDSLPAYARPTERWLSSYWITMFPIGLFGTFWGWFGWMTLRVPTLLFGLYALLSGALLLGAGGYSISALSQATNPQKRGFAFAVLSLAIGLLFLVVYTRQYTGHQARWLSPVLAPLIIVAVTGAHQLASWFPRLRGQSGIRILLVTMGVAWLVAIGTAITGFHVR
jgi:4-amino-4-deoxy-L-arabinose transferase-like glycosyltransferase